MKRLILALLAGACTSAAVAADYLLTVTRPNQLHVVDVAARKVTRTIDLPGDGIPSGISVADDGKIAYVLTNRFESVVGVDLDTGAQVFRADMSEGDLRVKSFMGVTVSHDGSRLYTYQIPTRIKRNEFESLDTRIAVYDTAAGLSAKPIKTFPAPRRISLLAPGATRDRVVALGWDLYVFDAAAGKLDKTFALRHWQRPGLGEPDILDMWHQYEQARVLATPYYAANTAADPSSPEAFKVGLMTFDLGREEMQLKEVANAETAIFSSVVNPANHNEVFSVMNQLYRADMASGRFTQLLPLEQTYYAVNISSDGKELYLGGALDKIAVVDSASFARLAEIQLPGGADQSTASIRMVRR